MKAFRTSLMTAVLLSAVPGFAFAQDSTMPPPAPAANDMSGGMAPGMQAPSAGMMKMDPIPNPPEKKHRKMHKKAEETSTDSSSSTTTTTTEAPAATGPAPDQHGTPTPAAPDTPPAAQ